MSRWNPRIALPFRSLVHARGQGRVVLSHVLCVGSDAMKRNVMDQHPIRHESLSTPLSQRSSNDRDRHSRATPGFFLRNNRVPNLICCLGCHPSAGKEAVLILLALSPTQQAQSAKREFPLTLHLKRCNNGILLRANFVLCFRGCCCYS